MARIEGEALPFGHAGIDRIVKLYADKLPAIWSQFVNKEENRESYYRVAQEGDFGAAVEVNQGVGISPQDFQTGPYKDTTAIKRGIGFGVAREVVESDVTGIIKRRAPKMARAMLRTLEADMANNVNLATSTIVSTPEGTALAGTQTINTGTFSNILTGNPALGITSLEQACQEMMIQPSQTGDFMMFSGPYALLVPPQLMFLAQRITGKPDPGNGRQPETFNNDGAPVRSHISKVVVDPFFTSPTGWAIVVDTEENPLLMVDRRPYDGQEEFDKLKDVYIYVATQIWSRVLKDWRGFIYSSGQGS